MQGVGAWIIIMVKLAGIDPSANQNTWIDQASSCPKNGCMSQLEMVVQNDFPKDAFQHCFLNKKVYNSFFCPTDGKVISHAQ